MAFASLSGWFKDESGSADMSGETRAGNFVSVF
jgi:hypothetical protein